MSVECRVEQKLQTGSLCRNIPVRRGAARNIETVPRSPLHHTQYHHQHSTPAWWSGGGGVYCDGDNVYTAITPAAGSYQVLDPVPTPFTHNSDS